MKDRLQRKSGRWMECPLFCVEKGKTGKIRLQEHAGDDKMTENKDKGRHSKKIWKEDRQRK